MKHYSLYIVPLLFSALWTLSACSASAGIREIPEGALIVDVRTPGEFKASHFPGAVNIPLDNLEARLSEFGDKNGPVVVYCRSGRRSGIAKDILTRKGFTKVQNGGGLNQMMALRKTP